MSEGHYPTINSGDFDTLEEHGCLGDTSSSASIVTSNSIFLPPGLLLEYKVYNLFYEISTCTFCVHRTEKKCQYISLYELKKYIINLQIF